MSQDSVRTAESGSLRSRRAGVIGCYTQPRPRSVPHRHLDAVRAQPARWAAPNGRRSTTGCRDRTCVCGRREDVAIWRRAAAGWPSSARCATSTVYSPYLLHRRTDLCTDPDRFAPDRWESGHTPPPLREAYIPFGAGPRKCIGDRFAFHATTLTLAVIAARWRLQHLPGIRARPTIGGPTLSPGRLRLRVATRI
ncbi:cytochrome P450 [Streptomyces sp. NPDC058475]|uniref:cytochrome P450 n=1 Tax=Streptomyces sp. NPDC058475 TaxID=3346518 RepID=UPI003668FF91